MEEESTKHDFLNSKMIQENSKDSELAEASDSPINEASDEEHQFLNNGEPDGIGYWGSVAHMIRATVGTGILLLPFEMKNLGYVTGTVLLLSASIIYYHIVHILLYMDARLRKHLKVNRLTYAIIADEIFSRAPFPINKFRKSLLFLIYVYYIVPTSKSISLVVISKNVEKIAKYYNIDLNPTIVITILIVVLTIFCMFRSILKILVPFSSTTNIFTLVIALVIIIYSIRYRNTNAVVHPIENLDFMPTIRGMAIFVNAVLSTDIMLPLKNSMREPQKLGGSFGALNATAVIIVIFYYGFALIPYLSYGDDVKENILSNIPVDDLLILCINIVYSLALFVSYILSFYACFDVVWSSKLQAELADSRYKFVVEYSIRIGFNVLAYLLAVGVSNLALISAIGGILGILLDVTFMPLLQIMLMFILNEKNNWTFCKNSLLIAFSLVFFSISIVDFVNEVVKLHKT